MYEFGKRRPRDQYALIHVELVPGEPGLVDQVGDRHPLPDAPFGKLEQFRKLALADFPRVDARHISMRQAKLRKNEPGSLVERIVGAVAITQPGRVETGRELADELLYGRGGRLCHACSGRIR